MLNRDVILSKIETIANRVAELARSDCKGMPTHTLNTVYNIFKGTLQSMLDEQDELSIDEVAQRYSVTTVTIHNWLKKHELPPPHFIEDKSRVKIPRSTIDELDKLYPHQKKTR